MTRKLVALMLALLLLTGSVALAESTVADRVQTQGNELMFWTPFIDRLAELPPIFQDIAKEEDFTFLWVATPTNMKDFLNLKIAGNEIPDILRDFDFPTYSSYVDQGILAELPVATIQENAPGLYDWSVKYGGENIWKYYERDGKNYSVPILWTLAVDNVVVGIREDLFEKAGAAIPTTIEEATASFTKIKDELGIAPVTGITSTGSGDSLSTLSWVFGAYGVGLNFYVGDDGEIHYGYIEDGAKEALATLRDWYDKGLIDKEFVVNTSDNAQEKWDSNRAAVVQHEWYFFIPGQAFYLGQFYEGAMALNPDAKITILDALKGPGGKSGYTQSNPVVSSGLQFGVHLEDQPEKVAKYLRIFDKYSFTREGVELLNYGYEGKTYTYDEAEGVKWLPGYETKEERDKYGIGIYGALPGCFNDYDLQARYMTQPKYMEARNAAQAKGGGYVDALVPVYRPVYNEKIDSLNMIIRQGFLDIITGARALDDFETLREEWLSAGGQAVMDEAVASYAALK